MLSKADLPTWKAWYPLDGVSLSREIPKSPGLYCICRVGRPDVDYIGQTGGRDQGLRGRLGHLKGVFKQEMPYKDPHVAGPALWALRCTSAEPFQVSVLEVGGSTQRRMGLEALAVSLYREEKRRSPTVNFGRVPMGFKPSSHYNLELVEAGRVFTGGPTADVLACHLPGVPPCGRLEDDPQSSEWCGHQWSPWEPAAKLLARLPKSSRGLYRLRCSRTHEVLYIGVGNAKARLAAHLSNAANPKNERGEVFHETGMMDASWVPADLPHHQLLELENDLIASHVLMLENPPAAQFLGQRVTSPAS